jgi:RNA polymerase sigma-70 factor (ECF subfamily)
MADFVIDRDAPRQEGEMVARFRALFDENFRVVWNALRRFGVAEADREDLANEVFFRVYKAIDQYDSGRPARPWLVAFAARVASEHRRLARHRHEVPGEGVEPRAPSSAPESKIERAEQRAVLAEALDTLDDDKRVVFVLHDLEEVATPDVARALDLPEGTVSSRLRAARADLLIAVKRIRARKGAS